MAAYYTSPVGTSGGTGAIGSPWDLQTALNKVTITGDDTLYLRGNAGSYIGRFTSTLTGSSGHPITVKSYPGEWAKIDGYRTTTLSASLSGTGTTSTIHLTDATGVVDGTTFMVDDEMIFVSDTTGGTITGVRAWGGTTEVAHSNGAFVWFLGTTLTINGSDVWYRDFEILDSNPNRSFATPGDASNRRGGEGAYVFGDNIKLVNLIIHDAQDGMFLDEGALNTEIYGVLTYNNGHVDPTRGEGHGLYIQNNTGTKTISNNISFNNYATGMKAFGEGGFANNVTYQNNTAFNNSSPATFVGNPAGYASTHRFVGIHAGTSVEPINNIIMDGNYVYNPSTAVVEEGNMRIGYQSQGGTNITITNNYVMGGDTAFGVDGISTGVTVTGNKFYADSSLANVNNNNVGTSGWVWNSNTYYDLGPLNTGGVPYSFHLNDKTNRFGGGNLTYDDVGNATGKGWKQWSGFDASSTYGTSVPTGQTVVVLPNNYQAGRANIVIYNWSLASTVNVSLSTTGLSVGQTFEVRNAQDYFNTPVLSNQTYSGGMSVTLPMTGLSVATPIGSPGGFTPASTAPEFGVFVVVPTAGAGSIPFGLNNVTLKGTAKII